MIGYQENLLTYRLVVIFLIFRQSGGVVILLTTKSEEKESTMLRASATSFRGKPDQIVLQSRLQGYSRFRGD